MKLKDTILPICFVFLLLSCKQTEESNTATKNEATSEINKSDDFLNRLYNLYEKKDLKSLKKELKIYGQTEPKSKTAIGITNLYTGYIFEYNSKMDSAQICYEKAIANLDDKDLNRELYLALARNAEVNSYLGMFDNAISLRYKALSLLEKSSISDKEKKHYEQISGLVEEFYLSRNYKTANSVLNNALQNSHKIKSNESISLLESSKAMMLLYEERYDESIKLSKHALAIKTQFKDTLGQINDINNIAMAYMGKADWKEAQVFLKKAQSICKKNYMPAILLNISHCLLELGEIDLAIEKANLALQITHKNKQTEESRVALMKLSQLYKLKSNPEKAFDYYRKSIKTRDTILNLEKEKAMQELATKYETKQKEEKIISLQKDKQLANQQKILFLVLIVFLIIIGSILFAYFHFRNKKNKELLETNQRLYESKLKLNQTELEYFTNNLINKSKLIDEMEERLNLFSTNHAEAEKSLKITQLTQMRILTNTDWITFKEHFEKVNPGYIQSVKRKYNNLTPAELRTLLLIKLNMESDEIAAVLGISLVSVKTARYRLKKKLGLAEEEDLISFVQNMSL